jgi:hypothetical protein
MVRVSEKFLHQITTLAKDGYSTIDSTNARFINAADPINNQDLVTKQYLENSLSTGTIRSSTTSTDNALVIWDGVDGYVIKNSTIIYDGDNLYPENTQTLNLGKGENLRWNDIHATNINLDGYLTGVSTLEADDGYFNNNVTINGKLTVGGLIDPTGLIITNQISSPGGTPEIGSTTIWARSSDGYIIATDEYGNDLQLNGIVPGTNNSNKILQSNATGNGVDYSIIDPSLSGEIEDDGNRHLKRNDVIYASDYPYNVRPINYLSSATATAGSNIITGLTVSSLLQNGDTLCIRKGGALPNLIPPPPPICSIEGTPGTRTETYYLSLVNNNYGLTAVSTGITVVNAPDILSDSDYVRVKITALEPIFGYVEENVNVSAFNIDNLPSGTIHPNGSFGNTLPINRVLLIAQTNPIENGIWEIVDSPIENIVPLVRPIDFASGAVIPAGSLVFGRGRTRNRAWQISTSVTVDATPVSFSSDDPYGVIVWIDTPRGTTRNTLGFVATRTTFANATHQFPYVYDDIGENTFATDAFSYSIPASPLPGCLFAKIVSGAGTSTFELDTNLISSGSVTVIPDSSEGLLQAIEDATNSPYLGRIIIPGNTLNTSYINCWRDLIIEKNGISFGGQYGVKARIKFGPINGIHVKQGGSGKTKLANLYLSSWSNRIFPPWFIGYKMLHAWGYTAEEEHHCSYAQGGLLFLQASFNIENIQISYNGGLGIAVVGTSDQDGSNTNLSTATDIIISSCYQGGIAVYGYDASQSSFTRCTVVGGDKIGILDYSFTGCYWNAPHLDSTYRSIAMLGANNNSLITSVYLEGGCGNGVGQSGTIWEGGTFGANIYYGTSYVRVGKTCTPFKITSRSRTGKGFELQLGSYTDTDTTYIGTVSTYTGDTISNGIYFLYRPDNNRYAYTVGTHHTTDTWMEVAINNTRNANLVSFPRGLLFGSETSPARNERRILLSDGKPTVRSSGVGAFLEWEPGDIIKDSSTQKMYSPRIRSASVAAVRINNYPYSISKKFKTSNNDGLLWCVTTPGVSAASEPVDYLTGFIGKNVTDGTAIVQCVGMCGPFSRDNDAAYTLGSVFQYINPNNMYGLYFKCTTPGTTSGSITMSVYETAAVGDVIVDGTAQFTAIRYPERQNATSYILNQLIAPQNSPYLFICTLAGITDVTEPAAYVSAEQSQQITDGTAKFTAQNFSTYPDWLEVGKTYEHIFRAKDISATGIDGYIRYLNAFDNQSSSDSNTLYNCIKILNENSTISKFRIDYLMCPSPDDITYTLVVCQNGSKGFSNPTAASDFNDTNLTITIPAGERSGSITFSQPIKAQAAIAIKLLTESLDTTIIGVVATVYID